MSTSSRTSPAAQVADYVSQCKVFVFLSKKEGDNKALVEAMFTNVPAIVFDKTIGGAGSRINRCDRNLLRR